MSQVTIYRQADIAPRLLVKEFRHRGCSSDSSQALELWMKVIIQIYWRYMRDTRSLPFDRGLPSNWKNGSKAGSRGGFS